MTDRDLELLRGAWARAVKIHDPERGSNPGMKPCWFKEHRVPLEEDRGVNVGPCEGWIEGAHWIRRRRVERWVRDQTGDEDLAVLAAWCPRNGAAACERHHARLDSHRMPPLVVPRLMLPENLLEFVADYGLENDLESNFS